MKIRHKSTHACIDILNVLLEGLLSGEQTSIVKAGQADSVLHIKIYIKNPKNVGYFIGRGQEIKNSILCIMKFIANQNGIKDVFLWVEDFSKLPTTTEETNG